MYLNNKEFLGESIFYYEYYYTILIYKYKRLLHSIKRYKSKKHFFLFRKIKINIIKKFIKIKLKINSKRRKLFLKYFKNYKLYAILKYFKLKKQRTTRPMKLILKNRRLLRYFFNYHKITSTKLNTRLGRFYKYFRFYNHFNLNNILGIILINSGVVLNLIDAFYVLKSKLVKVNNKKIKSFFHIIKTNDLISFTQVLFFSRYYLYFKKFNFRWLRRRKRKNNNILRRYINFNKLPKSVSTIIKRWLSLNSKLNSKNTHCEIDYRLGLIYLFFKTYKSKTASMIKNYYYNSLMIFNLWYYKF